MFHTKLLKYNKLKAQRKDELLKKGEYKQANHLRQTLDEIWESPRIKKEEIGENEVFLFREAPHFTTIDAICEKYKSKSIRSIRKERPTIVVIPEEKPPIYSGSIVYPLENILLDFLEKDGKVSRYISETEFFDLFIPQNTNLLTEDEIEKLTTWANSKDKGMLRMAHVYLFENFNPDVVANQLLMVFAKKINYSVFFYNIPRKYQAWQIAFNKHFPMMWK